MLELIYSSLLPYGRDHLASTPDFGFVEHLATYSKGLSPPSVPEQAGGAPAADERPACQGVRAAGPGGQRPGAQQPEAGDRQPPGPAQDQQVWRSLCTS